MMMQEEAAAQTAEMMGLFAKLVRADRETLLCYARARVEKYGQQDEAKTLFFCPVASLVVAPNSGVI